MNGNVLPMRPRQLTPSESERLQAYYIALSVQPEIRHASSIARAQIVDRIIAGMRAAARGFNPQDELDREGFAQAISLIVHDRTVAQNDGWLW